MTQFLGLVVAGALLMSTPTWLLAQDRNANTAAPAAAFNLEIDTTDEIKTLLEQHLELLRYRELTDLNDSELARLISIAHQNTQDLVATLGYFAPEIRIELQPASNAVTRRVTLRVVPGEPTVVSEFHIAFSGPMADDPAALLQRQKIQDDWSLRPGTRFTQTGWNAAKQKALRQLTTQRYPAGQLTTTLADIDPIGHSARLSVTLDSGPAYQLGGLIITGLKLYDTDFVTRLASLTPGADYEQTQLIAAQQRLTDSGFFDSVFISLDTSDGNPGNAPVRVQLLEAKKKKLVLGVGVSTDSGPRLTVEHTHNQLPGIGWRAVSKLLLDRKTQSVGSELLAPPDEKNWRWMTSALIQKQQSGSFDINSQRLRAGHSKTDDRFDQSYYLQYDRAETTANDAALLDIAQALSAYYAFTLRNFDSIPFPARGWGLGIELGCGTILGHQQDQYGRVLARWLGYQPLGGNDASQSALRAGRIVLRAQAGAVIAKEGITLPSTQLFLTGGDNTVRGYGLNDIGVTLPNGLITAGRYLGLGGLEWQRPITKNGQLTQWESTVFIDAGAVADTTANLQAKVGVGAGARWKSPVGPLQIDVAYGVQIQRWRLHLNVGFNF